MKKEYRSVLALHSFWFIPDFLDFKMNIYTESTANKQEHHYPNGQKDELLPRQNELNVNVTVLQRIHLRGGGSKYKY